MNRWNGIGRLTKAPEIRRTADNMAIGRFTVAIDRMKKVEGQPEADFIPIVVFGKTAENAEKYINKGSLVGVSGRIQTRSWTDTENKKHYATEIIADEVKYLEKKNSESSNSPQEQGNGFTPVDDNDDLPF